MDAKGNLVSRRSFILKIAAIAAGLIILAGYLSLTMMVPFGMLLLILGIVVGGIGAFMNTSAPPKSNHPRDRQFNYLNRLQEYRVSGLADDEGHAGPSFGLENVLAFAGFIAIVASIPFLVLNLAGR